MGKDIKTLESIEVTIVNKQGLKTIMPNLYMAESYAKGLWKGNVDKIEVKQVYKIND